MVRRRPVGLRYKNTIYPLTHFFVWGPFLVFYATLFFIWLVILGRILPPNISEPILDIMFGWLINTEPHGKRQLWTLIPYIISVVPTFWLYAKIWKRLLPQK